MHYMIPHPRVLKSLKPLSLSSPALSLSPPPLSNPKTSSKPLSLIRLFFSIFCPPTSKKTNQSSTLSSISVFFFFYFSSKFSLRSTTRRSYVSTFSSNRVQNRRTAVKRFQNTSASTLKAETPPRMTPRAATATIFSASSSFLFGFSCFRISFSFHVFCEMMGLL